MKGSEKQITWAKDIIANGSVKAAKNANSFIMGDLAGQLSRRHGINLTTVERAKLAQVFELIVDPATRMLNADKLAAVATKWSETANAGDIIAEGKLDNITPIAIAVADTAAALIK